MYEKIECHNCGLSIYLLDYEIIEFPNPLTKDSAILCQNCLQLPKYKELALQLDREQG